MVYFFKLDHGVVFSYFRQPFIKVGKNSIVEDGSSVLSYQNNVVITLVHTMAYVD